LAKKPKKAEPDGLKRKAMFEASQKEFRKCIYPKAPECQQSAIDAHSIQKSGKLSELAHDGQVYAFDLKPVFGETPTPHCLHLRGQKKATTFAGLCSEHDNRLFDPIDNNEIDLENPEHLFLLAYRSVLKNAHGALKHKMWTADAYNKLVSYGVADPEQTVMRDMKASAGRAADFTWLRKQELDHLHLSGAHDALGHEVVWLPEGDPAVGVSECFSTISRNGEEKFCALNVFPQEGRHVMVFSFVKGSRLALRDNFVNYLRYLPVAKRAQVASRIVLENCTDPILSPKVYSTFSTEQKLTIRNYYMQTALLANACAAPGYPEEARNELAKRTLEASGNVDRDDPGLNLFKPAGRGS
jgi:hypothetical protein